MAQTIKILDSKNAVEQLNALSIALGKVETRISKISADALKMNQSLSNLDSISKLTKRINAMEKAQKKANAETTKAIGINKKAIATQKQQAAATTTQATATKKVIASNRAATTSFITLGKSIRQAFSRFIGFTVISTALFGLFAAIKNTTKRVVEFDKVMTNLSAILNVNRKDLKALERQIIQVAGASIKTSTEVAKLAETLVVLGKTEAEVIKLLKPVNDLSIGLEATSQEAGELLIMTLNAFGESSDAAQEYADIIAKMRTSSALDFQRIKDALAFLAPVAKVAGKSFEETASMLAILVDNGIKASKAGRLTAASFLRLSKDGLTLEDAMDKVNKAQERGADETELLALATKLFGVNSAAVGIILSSNRDRMAELTDEFERANGTLKELTDIQLESISAKTDLLNSAWEKLVFSIDNGTGAISNFFDTWIVGTTIMLNQLTKVSTAQENVQKATGRQGESWIVQQLPLLDLFKTSYDELLEKQINFDKQNKTLDLNSLNILELIYRNLNDDIGFNNSLSEDMIALYKQQLIVIGKAIEAKKEELEIAENLSSKQILGIIKTVEWYRTEIKAQKALIELESERENIIPIQENINKLQKELNRLLGITLKGRKQELVFLDGSIGWLQKMIKENDLLIKQATDNTTRTKLREENVLLQKQLDLLAKARKFIDPKDLLRGTLADDSADILPGGPTIIAPDTPIPTLAEEIVEFADMYGTQIDQMNDISNMFFDNRIERLQQDRDANAEYFDNLIGLARGNEEEQDKLQAERDIKDKELREKQRKEAIKQAIFNKGLSIANIAVNTAEAITKAAAQVGTGFLLTTPVLIALGAAQAAAVIAAPLPRFKDGIENAPVGLAVVGDGGKHEYIEDRMGNILQTPKTDTLVNLGGGEKIHKDLDSLISAKGLTNDDIYKATILTTLANEKRMDSVKLEKVFDRTMKDLDKKLTKGIRDGFKNVNLHSHTTVDTEFMFYKNDTL
jgi:hypothetical protein